MPDVQKLFVDTEKIIADTSGKPVGINVNYLRDEDGNYPGARPVADALKMMKPGHLRYPGGEKSDFYLFSKAPFQKPLPQVYGWYSNQTAGYNIMDFDSFIEKARAVGAIPHVVAGYDSFKRTGITLEEYLQNAVEWVRYANVEKEYGVAYWEVGNENWHNNTGSPEELADIVCRFSRAMKQVDPSIKIGASGNSRDWWKRFLPRTARDIDFLTVSQYSCFEWGGYEYYPEHQEIDLTGQVTIALSSIDEFVPDEKDRLKVVVSELNSMDYSENGWKPDNNLGHALVTFDIIGQLLKNDRVLYGMIWNTRWVEGEKHDSIWYALDSKNDLLPPGRVLYIWGNFLSDRLVDISRTKDIVTYASMDSVTGQLKLFLINKAFENDHVSIKISNRKYSEGTIYCFHGSSHEDIRPKLNFCGAIAVAGDLIPEVELPAVSITVIDLKIG